MTRLLSLKSRKPETLVCPLFPFDTVGGGRSLRQQADDCLPLVLVRAFRLNLVRIVGSGAPAVVADVAIGAMGEQAANLWDVAVERCGMKRRHVLYADVLGVDINPFTEELHQRCVGFGRIAEYGDHSGARGLVEVGNILLGEPAVKEHLLAHPRHQGLLDFHAGHEVPGVVLACFPDQFECDGADRHKDQANTPENKAFHGVSTRQRRASGSAGQSGWAFGPRRGPRATG